MDTKTTPQMNNSPEAHHTVEVLHVDTIRDARTIVCKDIFNRVYYYQRNTEEIFSDWPDLTKTSEYIDSLRITGLKLKIVKEFSQLASGSQVSAEVKEEEDEIPDLPPAHKMSKGKRTVYSTTPKEEKEEWISVEERLPELKPLNPGRNSSDPVLVLTTSNDHFICELEELISTGERWWIIREVDEDVDRYSASKVTHWIYLSHLPAPPKQAEQNDKP